MSIEQQFESRKRFTRPCRLDALNVGLRRILHSVASCDAAAAAAHVNYTTVFDDLEPGLWTASSEADRDSVLAHLEVRETYCLIDGDQRRSDCDCVRHDYSRSYRHRVAVVDSLFENLAPDCLSRPREGPVEIGCRADQREMRECLRKIPKMSPIRTQFL